MGKIIFWLVVFFVVLLVLRLLNTANARNRRADSAKKAPPARDATMARCVSCGVYLPAADAIPGAHGPLCGDPQCAKQRGDRTG
jgi:hypothetical protein